MGRKIMTVQLSGQRPAEEHNGLERHHDALMKAHPADLIVVAVVRRAKRVLNDVTEEQYPVVRFARIEVVGEADEEAATAMLERAWKARTNNEALDLPEQDGGDDSSPFEAA
jgi:hypothetical protein